MGWFLGFRGRTFWFINRVVCYPERDSVLFTRPFGNEPPDWAQKSFEDVNDGIATVLNDPALIVEGISQSGSDPSKKRAWPME
jgi:hypothetical protein